MIWQMETQDVELKEDTSKTLIEVHRLFRRWFLLCIQYFAALGQTSLSSPRKISVIHKRIRHDFRNARSFSFLSEYDILISLERTVDTRHQI